MTLTNGEYYRPLVKMSEVIKLLHDNRERLNFSDNDINKFVGIPGQDFLKLTKQELINEPFELPLELAENLTKFILTLNAVDSPETFIGMSIAEVNEKMNKLRQENKVSPLLQFDYDHNTHDNKS